MPVIYSQTKWDTALADADGDYARVAVESGLLVEGNKFVQFTALPAHTHYSVFVNPITQTGNLFPGVTIASLGIPDNVWRFRTGTFNAVTQVGGNGDENYIIAHLVLYDREPTPQEEQYLAINGGAVPESLHANVVLHVPFTQRYAGVTP